MAADAIRKFSRRTPDERGPHRGCSPRCATSPAPSTTRRSTSGSARSSASSTTEAGDPLNRRFYLSTAPAFFPVIVEAARRGRAQPPRRRRGPRRHREAVRHDLAEAEELNRRVLTRASTSSQVFRIDHYLGKETVQNILAFRFANGIFEPLWNRNYIDHVQITAAEDIGIGTRAGYYDSAGALRDLVQNHMLQLLCLLCDGAAGDVHRRRGPRREGQGPARDPRRRRRRRSPEMAVRAQYAAGRGRRRGGRRATSRRRASRPTPTPRRTPRCASRSTTGAGRACRSTCARASAWRARSPRSPSRSSRSRTSASSRTARSACGPTSSS